MFLRRQDEGMHGPPPLRAARRTQLKRHGKTRFVIGEYCVECRAVTSDDGIGNVKAQSHSALVVRTWKRAALEGTDQPRKRHGLVPQQAVTDCKRFERSVRRRGD